MGLLDRFKPAPEIWVEVFPLATGKAWRVVLRGKVVRVSRDWFLTDNGLKEDMERAGLNRKWPVREVDR
jgi:hypothetical protein